MASSQYWKTTQPRPPSPARGELLVELTQEEIAQAPQDSRIKNCEYVASYSWLEGKKPAIVTPGMPPMWNPLASARKLEPDTGDFFRDQNAARFPSYPLAPAVLAVREAHEDFPTQDVDILICSSSLGKLSEFVRGRKKRFRIIVAKVGGTVFFIRRENSPTELIPDIRGYGNNFCKEYTKWETGVEGSVSHQRVIQYDFGGLRLLVRFECDGYHPEKASTLEVPETALVGHNSPQVTEGVSITRGGRAIAQDAIFDIKTRSVFDFKTKKINKEFDTTEHLQKYYLCQIPTLIVGFHSRGVFDDIRVIDMGQQIRDWEEENAAGLGQLAALLHRLVELAQTSETYLEICGAESGPLQIRRVASGVSDALPASLQAWWTRKREAESPDMEDNEDDCLWDYAISDHEESDEQSEKDYTACSAEDCGYCGHCRY